MPYLRVHGRQLALVHGVRDPATKRVEQRILFLLYSRTEAREALGRGDAHGKNRFEELLAERHPQIRFDWKRIRRGIEENLEVLPEVYESREGELPERFRKAMAGFVRELALCDPYLFPSAIGILRELRGELEALGDLMNLRLKMPFDRMQPAGDEFHWRFLLSGDEVPPDVEEHADGFYERGELDRAQAMARLLVAAFPKFADGYNLLGLVALARGEEKEATSWFEKTVEVGRTLFPRRFAKSRYWTHLETRPYIRGLRNLGLSLTRAGRYADALAISERLEKECGDDVTAMSHRASVYLNLGRWEDAAREALRLRSAIPSEGFTAAFALYEAGHRLDSLEAFLHAALNHPGTARALLGERSGRPETSKDAEDAGTAHDIARSLRGYWTKHFPRTRAWFRRILKHPTVAKLLGETQRLRREWYTHPKADRAVFTRLNEMHEPKFSRALASDLATSLGIVENSDALRRRG